MKKEFDNSNLREALRSIIDENAPINDDWQKSVLAAVGEKKPRLTPWVRRIAAAAATIAVVITGADLYWSQRTVSPQTSHTVNMTSEIVAVPEPVSICPAETVEPIAANTSEIMPEKKRRKKPQPVKEAVEIPVQEPIVVFDNDIYYSALEVNTETNNDLTPEEWMESLYVTELTNRYAVMISMIEPTEDTTNTTEL